MRFWLEATSAVFAVSAALLWLHSATVKLPKQFPIIVSTPAVPSHLVIGGMHEGYGKSDELDALGEALIKQSRYSAYAASCAALSALLQALLIFLPN
jgi:hypothetical protein